MAAEKTWRIKTLDGSEDLYVESDFSMEQVEGMLIFKRKECETTITYPISGLVRFTETVTDASTAPLASIGPS